MSIAYLKNFDMKWFKWFRKKRRYHWSGLSHYWLNKSDDLRFLASHPPTQVFTTEEQLKADRILFGIAIYTINEDGSKTRHDPTKIVIESDSKIKVLAK
jgi:hypothetical protein